MDNHYRLLVEIPRRQSHAHRPGLGELFGAKANLDGAMIEAYRRYGYWMFAIADHLKVHYATVSRRLKRTEKRNV